MIGLGKWRGLERHDELEGIYVDKLTAGVLVKTIGVADDKQYKICSQCS